jgi:glycosyltransferase involved in cell wall biosynthesis
MLMLDAPWVENWARAAGTVADVVRVHLVDSQREGAWFRSIDGDRDAYLVEVPRLDLPYSVLGPPADLPLALRVHRALSRIEKRNGPVDVVHAHFSDGARWLPYVKRWRSLPYVVTEHSTAWTLQSPDKVISQRGLAVAARAYAGAAAVLPVSESLHKALVGFGMPGNMQVVPNPVDTAVFTPTVEDLPAHPLRLVTVARLEAVKRIDAVIDATAAIVERGESVHLTVVGDGSRRAELERHARELLPPDAVEFVGWRTEDQIAQHLQAAHMLVSASTIENLPVAVIEALACGLPVVATGVGGVPELLGDVSCARIVERGDGDALLAAILDLRTWLPSARERARAASAAAAKYSIEAVGVELARVYDVATGKSTEKAGRS